MVLGNLIILLMAEQDIGQAYGWYAKQEFGLGEEFLRCIDACFNFIQRNPEMYELVYES